MQFCFHFVNLYPRQRIQAIWPNCTTCSMCTRTRTTVSVVAIELFETTICFALQKFVIFVQNYGPAICITFEGLFFLKQWQNIANTPHTCCGKAKQHFRYNQFTVLTFPAGMYSPEGTRMYPCFRYTKRALATHCGENMFFLTYLHHVTQI